MAHSNSMGGCKKICWHQRVWKRVLSSFLTWRLFHRGVLASHLFCCSPILAVIFSSVLVCVFTPLYLLPHACLSFLPSTVCLCPPSFAWLRYPPLCGHPPPSTSNYYLAPDLFLFTPHHSVQHLSSCPSIHARPCLHMHDF